MSDAAIPPDLLHRIRQVFAIRPTIPTVSQGKPNRIIRVDPDGIEVETNRSDAKGSGPQVVPAQMIVDAWSRLVTTGTLTQEEAGHRSAFICALFAQFDDVEVVSTRAPTMLRLTR